jgi:hypothetical protein
MFYSFARVSAVLRLKVDDYYHNGARRRLRLHEKGGKEHEMPVHHLLEQILNEYVETAGLRSGQPLFQSVNSTGTAVTGRALNRYNAWAAIRKRAKAAGFLTPVGCHTWRATGITIYLENDGRLEHAQQMAGHESPRTTKLYDRTKDEITLSECRTHSVLKLVPDRHCGLDLPPHISVTGQATMLECQTGLQPIGQFLDRCQRAGLSNLEDIEPIHVSRSQWPPSSKPYNRVRLICLIRSLVRAKVLPEAVHT